MEKSRKNQGDAGRKIFKKKSCVYLNSTVQTKMD